MLLSNRVFDAYRSEQSSPVTANPYACGAHWGYCTDRETGLEGSGPIGCGAGMFSREDYFQESSHVVDFSGIGRVNLNKVAHEH